MNSKPISSPSFPASPMQIKQALQLASVLQGDSPRLDAEILLASVLKKSRTYLYTWPEKELSPAEQESFKALLARREKGEPIAHITGEREFWSLPIKVNASTLIPRPDTECLVEKCLALFEGRDQPRRILDLGTGTGAIAFALAKEFPSAEVLAVDSSLAACELAKLNRRELGLNQVEILQSHWFDRVHGQFDLIVSNPPYIDEQDEHLTQGDVRFEPSSALVAGNSGMADLEIIIGRGRSFMRPGAWLVVEHGWDQGEKARLLFAAESFHNVFTAKDLGNNDRISGGQYVE